jgi:hypothetical protein
MINLPLTNEVVDFARMLIYQSGLPICDENDPCGCSCNCLEIWSVKIDIFCVEIETKLKTFRLKAFGEVQ